MSCDLAGTDSYRQLTNLPTDVQYHALRGFCGRLLPCPGERYRSRSQCWHIGYARGRRGPTAEFYGNPVVRIYDVGVAGLHRLLARLDDLRAA